ncbi:MAG TPA: hypothetical protein VFQ26_01300, partial [Nitrospiraceae bacterium]|nr:hypothetical protein [Nitrospiraceae bacterium]
MSDSSGQDLVILNLNRALQALVEAQTIQQTKKIVDIARAAEIFARRQRLGGEAIACAYDVKLMALRSLGQLLREMPKATGGDAQRTRFHKEIESPPTLADLGIDKKTSMIAQRLADLPQAEFERVRDGRTPMAQVLRAAKSATTSRVAWTPDSAEQRLLAAIN